MERVDFAEVAKHFSFPGREVSEDEVKFPVQSLVPEGRQQEFLRKLLQVPYSFQQEESKNTMAQDIRREIRRSHRGVDFEQIAMDELSSDVDGYSGSTAATFGDTTGSSLRGWPAHRR